MTCVVVGRHLRNVVVDVESGINGIAVEVVFVFEVDVHNDDRMIGATNMADEAVVVLRK